MITRAEMLKKSAPVLGTGLLVAPAAALAAPKGPRRELRRWLREQLETLEANERRTLRLRNRQEDVVRKTHDAITNRLSALKSELSSQREKDAADVAAEALHAQAKDVHVETQRVMAAELQMLRRQIAETERMLADL